MDDEAVTQILDAVRAVIVEAWPDVPCIVKAVDPTHADPVVAAGYTPGTTLPCFIVASPGAEKVDESASFELISLGVPCIVSYCKSGAPKNWASDPDIRRKRIQLEDLLYRNTLAGFPSSVFDGRFQTLEVYQSGAAKDIVVSPVVAVYTFTRARPGAA